MQRDNNHQTITNSLHLLPLPVPHRPLATPVTLMDLQTTISLSLERNHLLQVLDHRHQLMEDMGLHQHPTLNLVGKEDHPADHPAGRPVAMVTMETVPVEEAVATVATAMEWEADHQEDRLEVHREVPEITGTSLTLIFKFTFYIRWTPESIFANNWTV